MGTAAGFFGLTYQGPVNGLASNTLSIFNMDHPDDRAWLKLTFDFVAPDGKLKHDQIVELLQFFYRQRAEGPTRSGSYLHSYPQSEAAYMSSMFSGPDATLGFHELLSHLMEAQANFAEPTAPVEYNSNSVFRNDLNKHTRKMLDPQQQFRKPLLTSQEVGWAVKQTAASGRPFHLRTSATTQFADAAEKQAWGRSIGGEFSEFATKQLIQFGGFGMGV
ncbi:hypothetical protein AB1Y20_009717 [Prymnesium parvum]|eukprot:CAMPEP_0113232864 /NCGR_PEP_ID=MMETSP0008_2-20120614/2177_1 /TAXON_ID=97485 /ORGANISM="Prymnesium parvum" /LENGTH=218 /DNA_ID=CAMNT_0000079607 /DNA_START=50 /DNA_END=706 /DNA_ORIENTATION=- /assembly_acc=CAM_ASM_000153